MPFYNKAAATARWKYGDNAQFMKIEASQMDLVSRFRPASYPTLLYFKPKSNMQPTVMFKQAYTEENLGNFMILAMKQHDSL